MNIRLKYRKASVWCRVTKVPIFWCAIHAVRIHCRKGRLLRSDRLLVVVRPHLLAASATARSCPSRPPRPHLLPRHGPSGRRILRRLVVPLSSSIAVLQLGFQPPVLAWILTLFALSIAAFSAAFGQRRRAPARQAVVARRSHRRRSHTSSRMGPIATSAIPSTAGMFGVLIATGIVVSSILSSSPACAIFLLGTYIRVT